MRYFPPSISSLSSHQDSEWVDFKNDPDSESRLCFLTLKLNHLSSSQFLKKLGFWTRNSLYVSMSRASVTDNENCDLRLCGIQLQISCRCKEIYICIHTHTHTHTLPWRWSFWSLPLFKQEWLIRKQWKRQTGLGGSHSKEYKESLLHNCTRDVEYSAWVF